MRYYPRLRDLREDHDLTQTQLVEQLGIHKTTYTNYEQGKREPPFEFMIQLAEFYQVSLDYLAGWTNDIHMQANAPIKNPSNLERQAIHILHSLAPADQLLWLDQGKLLSKFHKQNNEQ